MNVDNQAAKPDSEPKSVTGKANRKLVVLGAGASRASGIVGGQADCLPPLNADFFTQLQRISEKKHKPTITKVMDDVVAQFGSNFALTLEEYFTQLEFLIEAVDIASRNPSLDRAALVSQRDNLMAALGAVLESSTMGFLRGNGCRLHRAVVEELSQGDSIISFNYDCLVDDALRRDRDGKWNPRWGYGFPGGYKVQGLPNWSPQVAALKKSSSIRLFKLHGSVNWQLPGSPGAPIRLKTRLHRQHGIPRFSIIPPVWNKPIGPKATILPYIWQESARALRAAEVVAVIGFAFSPTDLFAHSLFRIALKEKTKLRLLVLASPDKETRRRIRTVFDLPLLRKGVLVRQYDTFEELVDHLPAAFDY
jgi:hypothetical protein